MASLCLAPFAAAQVTFTITATAYADAAAQGYVQGNSYTFVLTTGASFSYNPPISQFGSGGVDSWTESSTAHDSLWASLSGSGLAGSYVRPTSSPLSYVRTYSFGALGLLASDDSVGGSIGLTTLGAGSLGAVEISISSSGAAPLFSIVSSYTPLDTYFQSYAGTYSTGFTSLDLVRLNDGLEETLATFQVTSLTIATSAVPEPSAYSMIFGIAGLSLTFWRRRIAT